MPSSLLDPPLYPPPMTPLSELREEGGREGGREREGEGGREGREWEGGSMCDTIQGGAPIYCTCTYCICAHTSIYMYMCTYKYIHAEEHIVYYGSTDKLYTERVAF